MKHELLIPVGSKEALVAAINGGADAVYLAGKKFGARAFANNFDTEDIIDAITTCHLYNVKVYVTVNTLIYDKEIEDVLNYIEILHKHGVDALIMQDVGLINLVHNLYPKLEIHASTQMHVHNADTLKFLENLGVKRVVFARELSLDYINNIDTKLEKEVFIHGALCIGYSGQCLFSSLIMNRSGNRGECAGMCRLPYKLLENDKIIDTDGDFILSPKELCSIDHFKELMESNVISFKVEGRMKSPLYVYTIARIYKSLMIQYDNKEDLKVNEDDYKLLCSIFNREFTSGHLFKDKNIMNIKSSNHKGLKVGKVVEITPKKIKIKLYEDIKQFDGIRFDKSNKGITLNFIYDSRDNLMNKGIKDNYIYLDNFIDLKELDDVYLTNPFVKIDEEITKKIPIDMKVIAHLGEELFVSISDGRNYTEIIGSVVESSINCPSKEDDIKRSMSKLGNTPFIPNTIDIELDDNIFISVGELNDLRRMIIDKLIALRTNNEEIIRNEYNLVNKNNEPISGLSILVRTPEQLKCAMDMNIDRIYITNKSLMNDRTIYRVPRDLLSYNDLPNNLLASDYASLYKYQNNYSDYYLNVCNKYTLNYVSKFSKLVTLSPELTVDQIKDMNITNQNVEVIVYGNIELMIMKYCPLNMLVNKSDKCSICKNNNKYYLKDRNDKLYLLINNSDTHSTSIMNYYYTNLIDKMNELESYGVHNFRIELLDQNYEETKRLIERVTRR